MKATALQEIEVDVPRRRWPRYPAYRRVHQSWLRQPEHWDERRFKFLLTSPLQYGANEAGDDATPGQPRFIRITDIDQNGNLRDDTFRSLPEEVAKPYLLQQGDVLLARSGATVGKSFFYRPSWGRAAFAGYLIRARLNTTKAIPEYIHYFTQSSPYWEWIGGAFIQATIQNVSAEKYGNLPVPLPPLDEQRTIAAFLDRETARIDELIAKKQRLIELLKEKRQAIISRAVTKGLDPNAPMKPSGIDWLGEIPAHWQAKRLRYSMRSVEQGWSPQCENRQADDDEWGVLKVGCVNGEQFDPSENKALPPELKPLPEYEIKEGDLLMSRANTRELLGSATVVGEIRPKLLLCDKLYRIRVQEVDVLPSFLLLFFESSAGRFQFERDADGTSGSMKNIGQDTIKNTVVPLPPLSEQQRIVDAITKQQNQVSDLRDAIEAAIKKLREHRKSLIAAAVTGQIDVRNYQKEAACP